MPEMTAALLTPEEAADMLRISPRTLRRMRGEGGPAFVTVTSRTIRYRIEDITKYLETRKSECHFELRKRKFINTISLSGVVDFGEVSKRKTSTKQKFEKRN